MDNPLLRIWVLSGLVGLGALIQFQFRLLPLELLRKELEFIARPWKISADKMYVRLHLVFILVAFTISVVSLLALLIFEGVERVQK